MNEIIIYITMSKASEPMCGNPITAQNVADAINGPDSHCVKGDEPGQWLIEEPKRCGIPAIDMHGIGRPYDVKNGAGEDIRVTVEDAYCFHGKDMPIALLSKVPKAVFERIVLMYKNLEVGQLVKYKNNPMDMSSPIHGETRKIQRVESYRSRTTGNQCVKVEGDAFIRDINELEVV